MNTDPIIPPIISAAAFMAQEQADPDAKSVELTEGSDAVAITHGDFSPYYIEMSRIKSPLHLLNWVCHLCEKGWATPGIIRALIEKVSAAKGWNFYKAS